MAQVLLFGILGLTSGALYLLFSLGLVITNRSSGVINFGATATGMFGAFVFWDLSQNHHMNAWLAATIGVATSAILSGLVQQIVMKPLRTAAPITRMVATLGVLTVIEEAASRIWTSNAVLVPSLLPTNAENVFGVYVGEDKLIICGIVTTLALGLGVVSRFTNFGQATLASAENPRAVAALGYSPNGLALGNWLIAGALAGVAGILLAPIVELQVDQFTLLILPALAAAVIGRLSSLPLTFLGGLLIGVVQSELVRYVSQPGWSAASPFLLIAVVLAFRGHDRTFRSKVAERLPNVGTGVLKLKVIAPILLAALVFSALAGPVWSSSVVVTVLGAIVVLSVVVVTGYSGQLSLAQFGFAGWGAWIAARFASAFDLSLIPSVLIGVALTIPLGIAVGLLCLRTRGVYLAIASLGLAATLQDLVFNNASLTGSTAGISVPSAHIFGVDVDFFSHPSRYAFVSLIAFSLCAVAVANIRRGRSGRRLLAVRANDRAAASLGIGTAAARLYGFVVGSAIAALGGALIAFENQSVIFTNYSPLQSIQVVSQAVVGGVGWIAGAINGGFLQVGSLTGTLLNDIGNNWGGYLTVIGGVLVIVTVLAAPDGLASQQWNFHGQLRDRLRIPRRPGPGPDLSNDTAKRVEPLRLEASSLEVRFGPTVALSDVSITVNPGTVVGLIGPNGAGKTTFIDAVTGFVRFRQGKILLGDKTITDLSAAQIGRAGVTRSFQSLELFEDMTILENLHVACEPRDAKAYLGDLIWPRRTPLTPTAVSTIRIFGLESVLSRKPREVPYGTRRLVGIARAVATGASVLLLDEPAAGLSDAETRELGTLVRSLAEDTGVGVLLVEHHVEMVMQSCHEVYVLNFGKLIAHGSPENVRADPAVVRAYLGVASQEASSSDHTAGSTLSTE